MPFNKSQQDHQLRNTDTNIYQHHLEEGSGKKERYLNLGTLHNLNVLWTATPVQLAIAVHSSIFSH